jgi:hypothetical protein
MHIDEAFRQRREVKTLVSYRVTAKDKGKACSFLAIQQGRYNGDRLEDQAMRGHEERKNPKAISYSTTASPECLETMG